ncbi:MAG TPA: DNA primase [Bryobacteraceae bacterium]|jgi:DNA primase|nr:DNA primase [Bryobacteraceae bacterium]
MDFAEQVKASVDIVKVIEEYVRLKKAGGSPRYTGLCPFHTEKTPSFSVHAGHQFYKCFGCNVSGDLFKFVMEIERISFFEALKLVAERNGMTMPKREYSDPDAKLRGALMEMHETAARVFQSNLNSPSGAQARQYLASRNVSPEQIAEFGLGFSDPGGNQLVRQFESRFAPDQLEQSGLVAKRQESTGYYDRFRGRLMFPIHNESGKVIGFGGRALRAGEEPKYLNSPETALYRKSYVLYNLHRAKDAVRKSDHTVLVEGYMDVIGVYSAGVHNVVASCGTALTNTQVRALKRHSERIVVNFDPDTAGANAAERSIQMLLDEGLRVRVLELGGDLDPDEYVKASGAEAYRQRLEKAPVYFHWLADRARQKFDMRTVEGRMDAFKFLAPKIQSIADRLERFAVANDVADYLGVDEKLVRDHFSKGAVEHPAPARRAGMPATERLLLHSLLASEAARAQVIPELSGMPAVDRFVSKNVFYALFAIHSDGGPLRFSDLEGRLSEADRDLLSSAVFADEVLEEEKAAEQAMACLRSLKSQDPRSEAAALRARIKAAERQGNLEEAMRLAEELDQRSRAATATPR